MLEEFQRIEFLRRTHLFRGLSDGELKPVSDALVEKVFAPGEVIVRQGEAGDNFYMVYSGLVSITRMLRDKEQKLADLVSGDHFGEEALLKRTRRTATIVAKEETTLLVLSGMDLDHFLKEIDGLRSKFDVTIASNRLARSKQFTWLEEGEAIYFITRKHIILLWESLVWPVLALLVPVTLLIVYLFIPSAVFLWLAGLVLLGVVAAIYLKWLDWGNDYYIVTNKRVLFLEKVILLYDSRQEAPLTSILSVNTQNDVAGRTFGYGDVVVRTWVGNIVFKTIGYPQEVETLLREYWERTKKVNRQADVAAMKQLLRQKLGLEPPTPPPPPPKPATKPAYSFNLFKIRFEEKGIITYRKHWVVLLNQTWLPGLLFLACLVLVIRDFFINGLVRTNYTLPEIVIPLMVPIFLWWLYQVMDWSNDKFQVTEDQIFDIDKTPFGRMQKNVAPLDNILNMEARRDGFWQMLFDYGSVHISVGGAKMVFEDVMHPNEVQQDIDQRRVARKEKVERDRATGERERLAEIFATYHNYSATLREEAEEKARQEAAASQLPAKSRSHRK